MPLTYKEAKEQLFGADYMPIPGSTDHLKIRELMKKSAEKKRVIEPIVLAEMPTVNPINKVPPAPRPNHIPTKNEVFGTPEFQKHYITYLDRISVGTTRQRIVQNQKENLSNNVESNAKTTIE